MQFVSCYGGIWRLSDRAFKRFLKNAAAGQPWNLNDYGKMVVPQTDMNATDLTAEQAQEILNGADAAEVTAREPEEDDV